MENQENDDKKPQLAPVQLGPNTEFKFDCHKDCSCFTECCRKIDIMLTPYDVIRMKKRLGLNSDEFLLLYTEVKLLKNTDMPVATLKLLDDERESCPFVKDGEGCIIYEDRPTTCRYYPLGSASLSYTEEETEEEDFFFMVEEPHCKGFDNDKTWSVDSWRTHEGVIECDRVNDGWTNLLVRKKSIPSSVKLTEQSKKMFFDISYNTEKFRRFVFESTFLTVYKVEEEILEKIKEDDIALIEFGFDWLKFILFQEGDFKKNEDVAAKRAK